MLTKDLLRVRANGDYLKPGFLRNDDPEWLALAGELIALYSEGIGDSADMLDTEANAYVMKYHDVKIARGIHKVIRGRAVFSGEDDDFPYVDERRKLFLETAKFLKEGTLPEPARDVRDAILHAHPTGLGERGIYADLPENEKLVRFRKTFPQEALDRYNTGLVQGILLTADSMDVTIPLTSAPSDQRALFRSIRFFRLLFTGRIENGRICIHLDGPASILENSTKYGLQMACFFPSLCRQPEWKMSCRVHYNGKERKLNLDSTLGLRSYQAQFSGPLEEHKMFVNYFRTQNTGWEISDAPGFLPTEVQKVIVPDFEFKREGEPTVFVELFHRWHASQLEERLAWCEANPEKCLILGIDRSLLKKDGILKERLESSPYFERNGFLFRDFPGVENVLKVLNGGKK